MGWRLINFLKYINSKRPEQFAVAASILTITILGIIALSGTPIVSDFQENIWDKFYSVTNYISPPETSDELVVVAFDKRTLNAFNGQIDIDTWREKVLTTSKYAEIVAVDCGLKEEDIPDKADTQIEERPENVIFPVFAAGGVVKDRYVQAVSWESPCLPQGKYPDAKFGHTVCVIDNDGVVRRIPLFVRVDESNPIKALSYTAAVNSKHSEVEIIPGANNDFLALKDRIIRMEMGDSFRPYFHKIEEFEKVSLIDVGTESYPMENFKNKIVLFGVDLEARGTHYINPVSKRKLLSSLNIQASAINSLLTGQVFSTQKTSSIFLIAFLVSLVSSILFSRTSVIKSGIIAVVFFMAYFAAAIYLFMEFTLIDTIYGPLAIVLSFSFVHAFLHAEEARERKLVQDIFGKYLKPEIVSDLVNNPKEAMNSLKGTLRESTVLFADIRGFTSFCEHKTPQEVVNILNELFEEASEVIFSEGGMIDKYIGDEVMALFNIPTDQEDHADRAVRAAIKITRNMERRGATGLSFGIGINSGEVVAGNIGSSKRLEYTAIGGAVNLASRVCNIAEGNEILITKETYKKLNSNYKIEEIGLKSIKGMKRKVKLYKVIT